MEGCPFCRIAGRQIPATIVHEDERVLAFEDMNPQAPVHVLVIPRKHIATLNDAVEEDRDLLGDLCLAASAVARRRGLDSRGYRLVLNTLQGAGQTVFHVHLHLLGGRAFSWPPG